MHYTTTQYTDAELLQKIAKDDATAFEKLWYRYWETIYNAAFKRLQNEDQCMDLVQDLFTDLWERRTNLQIDNMSAYLNTAIRYKVYKLLAKDKVNNSFYKEFEQVFSAATATADSSTLEKELLVLAKKWLDMLPAKRREIFILHYRDHLSTAQIAEKLGISQKTVQNQLYIASSEFKDKLIELLVLIAAT